MAHGDPRPRGNGGILTIRSVSAKLHRFHHRRSAAMPKHIILTSHPAGGKNRPPIVWGAPDAEPRGPIVGTPREKHRNVIGAHNGAYSLYRALAIAAGQLSPIHIPDLTNTAPVETIGPFPQWGDPTKIVS